MDEHEFDSAHSGVMALCVCSGPTEFVRNPVVDLLSIIALRASGAQATWSVNTWARLTADRQQLQAAGVLSYRPRWFEKEAPSSYPEQASDDA